MLGSACCGASTMYAHGSASYCLLRFHYFSSRGSYVFQLASQAITLQSANPNTHRFKTQIQVSVNNSIFLKPIELIFAFEG